MSDDTDAKIEIENSRPEKNSKEPKRSPSKGTDVIIDEDEDEDDDDDDE